jgi:hypothetical protein
MATEREEGNEQQEELGRDPKPCSFEGDSGAGLEMEMVLQNPEFTDRTSSSSGQHTRIYPSVRGCDRETIGIGPSSLLVAQAAAEDESILPLMQARYSPSASETLLVIYSMTASVYLSTCLPVCLSMSLSLPLLKKRSM